MEPYEVPRGAIIIGGKSYPCMSEVKLWTETGLEFKKGQGGLKRIGTPKMLVLHFTAGEETRQGLYNVLVQRGLGIEFSIDREGIILQHCDPLVVNTYDAGKWNSVSAGVEVHCYGHGPVIPKAGRDRKTYEAKINGHTFTFASFYDPQMKGLMDLCDTYCEALKLPKQFPTNDGLIPDAALNKYSGVIGHYHLSNQKTDPGPEPFKVLESKGYKPVKL